MATSIQAQLNEQWDQRFNELLAWREENGSCWVPKAEGPLGRWVARQRELRKTGKMLPERLSLLESIDFTWNTNEAAWAEKYALLTSWTLAHGHCCVPTADEDIGMWVAKQRQLKRQGRLSKPRIRQLESLGFVWSTSSVEWEEKFGMLQAWRARHGHLRVPFNEGELGWWVNTQRQNRRKGKLSAERERSLTSIGFVWEPGHYQRKRSNETFSENSCEFVDPPEIYTNGNNFGSYIQPPTLKKPRYVAPTFTSTTSQYEDLLSATIGRGSSESARLIFNIGHMSPCPSDEEEIHVKQEIAPGNSSVPEFRSGNIPLLELKSEPKSPLAGCFSSENQSPVSVIDANAENLADLDMAFLNRPTAPKAWPVVTYKWNEAPQMDAAGILPQPF